MKEVASEIVLSARKAIGAGYKNEICTTACEKCSMNKLCFHISSLIRARIHIREYLPHI